MRNIFWGFLFIFLDFHINTGLSSIGLIPDLVGYLFLLSGINQLRKESPRFVAIRPFVMGLTVYSCVTYLVDLLGITPRLGTIAIFILAVFSTVASLYISYNIVKGIKDIEGVRGAALGSEHMLAVWKVMAFCYMLSVLTIFLPGLMFICIVISTIVSIVFLMAVHYAQKRYYEILPVFYPVKENNNDDADSDEFNT